VELQVMAAKLKLITAPAVEPVTLAEAKAHCRVEHSEEDALITSIIVSAREQAEHITGRPLITQTWEAVLDEFPICEVRLGKANVLSITSVKYLDLDGVEQTMSSGLYMLDAEDSADCWLHPAINTNWPSTQDIVNAVRVRFACGYGAAASAVPQSVKDWIKLTVAHYYANRESVAVNNLAELPHVERLLDRVRVWAP
jgi:uncharacterized phiE125 gp8 family phage protein